MSSSEHGLGKVLRLGVVFSHPTQHHAPLWRRLAEQPGLRVTVYYLSNHGQVPSDLGEFGKGLVWDVDLMQGYEWFVLKTVLGRVTASINWRLFNPSLMRCPRSDRVDAVWVPGFNNLSYMLAMLLCRARGIPIISQCDSTH